MRETGFYQTIGNKKSFIPYPLPPNPPLIISAELSQLHEKTNFALDKLNKMSSKWKWP